MNFVRRKNNRGQITDGGFSLLEVLLAVVLLGLIATPILQMFYSSMAMNLKSKRYLAAADLGQSVIEALSAQSWDSSKGTVKMSKKTVPTEIADCDCTVYGLKDFYLDNTDSKLEIVTDSDINNAIANYPIDQIVPEGSTPLKWSPIYYVHNFTDGEKAGYDNEADAAILNKVQESPFKGLYKGDEYLNDSGSVVSFDSNDKRYCNYYFEKVNYAGNDYNIRICVDLKYDLEGDSSKKYYVVGVNVYVYEFSKDVRFDSTNVKNGSVVLIETVSTTVPNER